MPISDKTYSNDDLIHDLLAGKDWTGAVCINRAEEFCPSEDIMDSDWRKRAMDRTSKECLGCPLFEECLDELMAHVTDRERAVPLGIMAGVVTFQMSRNQISKVATNAYIDWVREQSNAEVTQHKLAS